MSCGPPIEVARWRLERSLAWCSPMVVWRCAIGTSPSIASSRPTLSVDVARLGRRPDNARRGLNVDRTRDRERGLAGRRVRRVAPRGAAGAQRDPGANATGQCRTPARPPPGPAAPRRARRNAVDRHRRRGVPTGRGRLAGDHAGRGPSCPNTATSDAAASMSSHPRRRISCPYRSRRPRRWIGGSLRRVSLQLSPVVVLLDGRQARPSCGPLRRRGGR